MTTLTPELDLTPTWRAGMAPIVGMASHPSMQRLTVEQILAGRAVASQRRESAIADLDPCDELDLLVACYDRRIAAADLAIAWREGRRG